MSPPHLRSEHLGGKSFNGISRLTLLSPPHVVRVPWSDDLPPASFRFFVGLILRARPVLSERHVCKEVSSDTLALS